MNAHATRLALLLCAVVALAVSGCTGAGEPKVPTGSSGGYGGRAMFSISSPAFEANGLMPKEHAMQAAGGQNVSPPYEWRNTPAGTKSFALVVVDEHPMANGWVHWAVAALPAETRRLAAGASGASIPAGAIELRNTFGSQGWGGPEPPSGSGRHEYKATLYALDIADPGVANGASAAELLRAIEGHVLGQTSVSGFFSR